MGGEKEDYSLISVANQSKRSFVNSKLDNESDFNGDADICTGAQSMEKVDELYRTIIEEFSGAKQSKSSTKFENNNFLAESSTKIDGSAVDVSVSNEKNLEEISDHVAKSDEEYHKLKAVIRNHQKKSFDLKKVISIQKSEAETINHELKKEMLDRSEKEGFYKNKLESLSVELSEKKKTLSNSRSVIMQQKEELDDKDKLIHQLKIEVGARKSMHHPEKLQQALKEKHDMIVNVHNITKELSTHYLSKLAEYKTVTNATRKMNRDLQDKLENSKIKSNKVFVELRSELDQNRKVLNEFKKLSKELDSEVRKRESIIKGLYEENQDVNRELSDSKSKAEMYEKIALKSKNDAFTYHEKVEKISCELQKNKNESRGLAKLVPKLTEEINHARKQLAVLRDEYEERVVRIKEKHEGELQEFFSNQTKSDMALKTQIYSLNQDVQQLENQLLGEKEKQQIIATELNNKLASLMNSDEPIISNVPKTINVDY